MTLTELSLTSFLDELSSASPSPGGGAAAAFAGATGASLVAMVCRLTIGRKSYQHVDAEFQAMLPRAEALHKQLLDLMAQDADAYTAVIAAYQLPKENDAEKMARTAAVQNALKHASEVPLEVAQACAEVLALSEKAAAEGNKNAASDGGAGALLAEAGLRAALLNVEINLGLIQDEAFVNRMRDEVEPLKKAALKRQAILDTVQARL